VSFCCFHFSSLAQDKKTGTIKGQSARRAGLAVSVAVILLEGDREVSRALTDKRVSS